VLADVIREGGREAAGVTPAVEVVILSTRFFDIAREINGWPAAERLSVPRVADCEPGNLDAQRAQQVLPPFRRRCFRKKAAPEGAAFDLS
jgi:hypothetical protein